MPNLALCLHFDLNETVIVGDPAGGDSFEQSLSKCIAKSAFVRLHPDGTTLTWHDGSPLDPQKRSPDAPVPPLLCPWDPPRDLIPVYWSELKPHATAFVEDGSPGVIYRPLFEQMKQALRWPDGAPKDERLLHEDGEHQVSNYGMGRVCGWEKAGRLPRAPRARSRRAHAHYFFPVF
jgi:hypothetical protein